MFPTVQLQLLGTRADIQCPDSGQVRRPAGLGQHSRVRQYGHLDLHHSPRPTEHLHGVSPPGASVRGRPDGDVVLHHRRRDLDAGRPVVRRERLLQVLQVPADAGALPVHLHPGGDRVRQAVRRPVSDEEDQGEASGPQIRLHRLDSELWPLSTPGERFVKTYTLINEEILYS